MALMGFMFELGAVIEIVVFSAKALSDFFNPESLRAPPPL
jgi:hypothetical protein